MHFYTGYVTSRMAAQYNEDKYFSASITNLSCQNPFLITFEITIIVFESD